MSKQADEVMSKFTPDVETKKVDTSRKLKIGIIGTGWIAESHILSYKKMPDVEIVAAADLIPGKAEAFMKKFGVEGVRFYPSHRLLFMCRTCVSWFRRVCVRSTFLAARARAALNRRVRSRAAQFRRHFVM